MITLHRLGHQAEEFHLNPDLVVTVEANPDTVITLLSGTKIIVAEPPERVVAEIKQYRCEVLAGAIERREAPQQPSGAAANRAGQGVLLAFERTDHAQ